LRSGNVAERGIGTPPGSAPLGTAQWMSETEALDRFAFDDRLFAQNADGLWEGRANGQIWVGETFDGGPVPIGYRDDRHVLLVSGTRGGEGTGVIIPNLCLWPGSCIVIDPKGENATVTARRRGMGSEYAYGLNQTVRILDPFGEVQLDPALKARTTRSTRSIPRAISRSTTPGASRPRSSSSKTSTTRSGSRPPAI
jgi:hypothetical protein